MTSVSKETCGRVFRKIEALQRETPDEAVTQKQVITKLKGRTNRSKLSDRHVRRVFQKLHEEGRIAKSERGQYWLPEYLDMQREYLKKRIEFERGFWEVLTSKVIVELKQKQQYLEGYYEDLLEQKEREEILKNK